MSTQLTSCLGRFSYFYGLKPRKNSEDGTESYGTAFLFSKSETVFKAQLDKAYEDAKEEGKLTKWGGKIPPNIRPIVKDGDKDYPDDPTYKGMWYINANAKITKPPGIVDRNRMPLYDDSQAYSGMYGRISISVYPFKVPSNQGVGIGFRGAQKWRDGEPLGSVFVADREFADDIIELDDPGSLD